MLKAQDNRVRRATDAGAFGRVAVLAGGASAEREISLLTGAAVLAALLERGVDAHPLDPQSDTLDSLSREHFDRVWIALHGRGGEDGAIQGYLQTVGLPYTGSGVAGSALAMDKHRTKQVLSAAGLPTPRWRAVADAAECAEAALQLGMPVVVKPALEGSSIGMSKVTDPEDLAAAWRHAAAQCAIVIVETWVEGAEYSAAILHREVLPLIRIQPANEFYDYDAKYLSDATRYSCPAGLQPAAEQALAEMSLAAFDAVGASGWGRVDFMLAADGSPAILEINTVPGMTSHSLVPMAARQAGIDFAELCWRILETSLRDSSTAAAAMPAAGSRSC
ncbi:MAG: D-alanine--D-alanine ligase [Gammaproteobacteria bacterium]|jgi:D-alanine-D-alanine ligase|nr:D-alanine--D-alanine ligase [Gammaproteobacteria bacterium]